MTQEIIMTESDQKLAILQNKVNSYIQTNSKDINQAFGSIENDWSKLNDFLVPLKDLKFSTGEDKVLIDGFSNAQLKFNDHSIVQVATKLNVPSGYLKDLYKGSAWQKDLAVEILNKHSGNATRDRVLIREVDGVARGILSDQYKRLSTRIIFLAFIAEIQKYGMVLMNSFNGDSKSYIEAINPNILSIPTSKNGTVHMVYGLQLRNSEFGDGALELRGYEMQCVCLNGLVTKSEIREVHLGKRLPSNIEWSNQTYQRDSQAKASIVSDYIKHFFSEDAVRLKREKILKASSIDLDIEKEIKKLPKLGMNEEEAKETHMILLRNNPSDGVQGEATLWKFAQAVGAVARNRENPQRKREIEEVAGAILERTGF
jgi:hypothetical protein